MRRIRSARGRRVLSVLAALAVAFSGLVAVAPAASAASTFNLVVMGDSLSSGEGTSDYVNGTNNPISNMCHRSNESYAQQYANMFNAATGDSYSVLNEACSGAGTTEIYTDANPNANTGGVVDAGESAQTNTLSALGSNNRLVVLSVGFNDLGVLKFAENCYELTQDGNAEDNCLTNLQTFNVPGVGSYQTNYNKLPAELHTAFQKIEAAVPPGTEVAVLNYPQVYPANYTGSCGTLPGGTPVVTSQAMLNTARTIISNLNAFIADEVLDYQNFVLVNEEKALAGHDLCAGANSDVNPIDVTLDNGQIDVHDESLHPTTAGYTLMAQVLAERLDAGFFSNGTSDSNIASAYRTDGGLSLLGYPFDNGGGPYVHFWNLPGDDVQDFTGGSGGQAIIVEGSRGTFFLNGSLLTEYVFGGYAKTCLAPTDNAYASGGGTRQDFINCYMTETSSGAVTVHGPNPNTCTDYGGSVETGPNACIGFRTAPPAGQPASGNVWLSGGGVGLFGQEVWTYANGATATSTAIYDLSGLGASHAWTLQAYVPSNHSNASHAHYRYCVPDQACINGYVNQNNYTNAWANFGTICTDGTVEITLADDGGDAYPAQVGADAIRAIPSGLSC